MERAQASSDGRKKPFLIKLVLVGKLGVGKSGVNAYVPRDCAIFSRCMSKACCLCYVQKLVVIVFVFRTSLILCVFLQTQLIFQTKYFSVVFVAMIVRFLTKRFIGEYDPKIGTYNSSRSSLYSVVCFDKHHNYPTIHIKSFINERAKYPCLHTNAKLSRYFIDSSSERTHEVHSLSKSENRLSVNFIFEPVITFKPWYFFPLDGFFKRIICLFYFSYGFFSFLLTSSDFVHGSFFIL